MKTLKYNYFLNFLRVRFFSINIEKEKFFYSNKFSLKKNIY